MRRPKKGAGGISPSYFKKTDLIKLEDSIRELSGDIKLILTERKDLTKLTQNELKELNILIDLLRTKLTFLDNNLKLMQIYMEEKGKNADSNPKDN